KQGLEDLQRLPEWQELTQEERGNVSSDIDGLAIAAAKDISGLKQLLANDYDINTRLSTLRDSIRKNGQERARQRVEEERAASGSDQPLRLSRSVSISS